MPLNHQLKVAFVHIPKAAGTSVEKALGMMSASAVDKVEDTLWGFCADSKYSTTFYQHLLAREMVEVAPKAMDEYFSFAIIRNPYARAVSSWQWKMKVGVAKKGISFKEFLETKYEGNHDLPQYDFITKDGKVIVDKVIRFEELSKGWEEVCSYLGKELELPKSNVSSEGKHYSEYYDKETRQMVEKLFSKDINLFGYKFETPKVKKPKKRSWWR
jgi:hypothetical protein